MKKSTIGAISFLAGAMLMTTVSTFAAPIYKSVTALINETLLVELNGVNKKLESPAITYDSKTYVSIRDIANLVGVDIKWDSASKTVKITTNPESITEADALNQNGNVIKNPREIIIILSNKYPEAKISIDENGKLLLNDSTYQLQLVDKVKRLFNVQILIDNDILLRSDI